MKENSVEYAGFWLRFVAYLIDSVIMFPIVFIISFISSLISIFIENVFILLGFNLLINILNNYKKKSSCL